MHIVNFLKNAKLGSLVLAGAFASSVANAEKYNIGGYEINVDTTVSTGVTYLTKDRRDAYLPEGNGGNPNINPTTSLATGAACLGTTAVYNSFCQELPTSVTFNHDGSINSDDGRLNFDRGDLVSAPVKARLEFETSSGNWSAFLRTNMYYDAALMSDSSFERGGLNDKGETNAGRNLTVLDAFVSWDGDTNGMPYMVRIGRQVINWGENTFIPGGNSSFNPIDVAALRQPGAEIKDALLPVEAIYGSLQVTQDLTIEAYVGGWDDYKLDAGGTLFGGSDTFTQGTKNGNGGLYFIGGGPTSGPQFACDTAGLTAAGLTNSATISAAMQTAGMSTYCTNSPNTDVLNNWTAGASEQERIAAGDRAIARGANDDGDEAYGIAVRYYAENFNSTEFGFYYQKADSRLPYISYSSGTNKIMGTSTGYTSSTVSRGASAMGFYGAGASSVYGALGTFYNPLYNTISVDDPMGLLTNATIVSEAEAGLSAASSGAVTSLSSTAGTLARYQEVHAGLVARQLNSNVTANSVYDAAGQLPTGATTVSLNTELGLFAEYPEIETYGFSFNTNIAGHTVQGDFNYRPDFPIQIDTDVLTINALFNACAFTSVGTYEGSYQALATLGNERGSYNSMTGTATALGTGADDAIGCRQSSYIQGWQEEYDVTSWNLGTTSIFTSSNPVVQALGADVGVFVTDVQGVVVPDIYKDRGLGSLNTGPNTLAPANNHCIGGSDLPLNGILSIDNVLTSDNFAETSVGACRSTDSSWGMTLLGSLQYNNFAGTPYTVSPQVVYQMGINGKSPFPAGFWREDQGSVAVSVNVEYLGQWKGTVAYRDYLGDTHRSYNLDRNTLSASLSYAF